VSAREAAETLERLGLSSYEAKVFVALHRLGGGTAQAVADLSGVPRSQVYGAAEDLADRGFVELVESAPKRYRPVSLDTAREQLRERLQRETDRAFEDLAALREDHAEEGDDGDGVTTLRGRHPVDGRVRALLDRAESLVVYVVPAAWAVGDDVAGRLADLAAAGVDVTVVSEDPAVGARFEDAPVRAFVVDGDQMGEMTGRTLLGDEAPLLLSVVEGDDETALWTAGTSIGRILAQFVHSGMESGLDDR
jgi:sugar-specific transcriptional regulator TrmB